MDYTPSATVETTGMFHFFAAHLTAKMPTMTSRIMMT